MAALSDRRGQLLLSTAFALGVLFVVLALALNTAIFTTNLGTQGGDDVGAQHVQQLRADLARGTAEAIEHRNREAATGYGDLVANLSADVDRLGALTERHESLTGGTATLRVVAVTNGTVLRQTNASRALTNESGADNWTLAEDVTGRRGLESNLSTASLVETAADTASELRDAEVFHVRATFENGTDRRLFVYADGGDVLVAVEATDGTLRGPCRVTPTDETVRIDTGSATVDGQRCEPLSTLAVVEDEHDLAVRFGSNARGTFSVVVDRQRALVDGSDYGPEGTANAPYRSAGIYDATIELDYATPKLTYRTNVTAGPGDASA